MVKIILKDKIESLDNQSPIKAFEKLGVPMDCHNGICGLCKIKIIEGIKNINPKTSEEEDFPLEDGERLACQCHKVKADLKIEKAEW